ncbi:2-polyprenylphenol 6-hydroxylase [Methylocella sp.]|uniref:2-polyprenylphenol 6-hydroxylase n=1 Tax=Methylocella sp. TaxID=1978226 RepID=UPI0037834E54
MSTPASFFRLARAGLTLARAGVFRDVDPSIAPAPARLPLALAKFLARRPKRGAPASGLSELPAAISALGPSYVKLGQFLATRPDVVGPEVVRALERLQDRMAPFPREVAVKTVEQAFDRPIGEVFVSFSEPVAAASIAQVHKARTRTPDGERDVAVKVLRPGVERRFRRDLGDMFAAARLAERLSPDMRRLKPVEVIDSMARSVRMEMDFRLEAAAASEFGENVAQDKDFGAPNVDWDRTAREVLTLEWVEGRPLSDVAGLRASGADLPRLGRVLIQSFLLHAMRDGFFHADMHPGNLFVTADERLVAVDFGIMGRLGYKERRFLAEILYGFITRDYLRVAQVHFEAGYVPRAHRVEDFAQAIRAIGEPIHARAADQISMARLLTLLFEITGLFDMKTRTELVLLQKTMVVVEGVGRALDPKLNMWTTAEPVVGAWIERNLGPRGKIEDAGRAARALGDFAAALPATLLRGEALLQRVEEMADEGLELSASAVESVGAAVGRGARLGHIALWIIAFAVVVLLLR